MKVATRLKIGGKNSKVILFGQPDTKEELAEMYRLRHDVYVRRGYIRPDFYSDGLDKDSYDEEGKSVYFIARLEGGKILGVIRLILSDPLPTEEAFSFQEPSPMLKISRNRRGELGRLVIIPPDKEQGEYLPRNLVLLFMFDLLAEYGLTHSVDGGYVFVKKSLKVKLKKVRAPLHYIKQFIQRYPKDGVLFPYFSQQDDLVEPAYFITKEFKSFVNRVLRYTMLVKEVGPGNYILKNNLYTKFLKSLKII